MSAVSKATGEVAEHSVGCEVSIASKATGGVVKRAKRAQLLVHTIIL